MSRTHEDLIDEARELLMQKGFSESEIFMEYKLTPEGARRGFRVDVAGVRIDKKIAVECGTLQTDKFSQLQLFFDEVIHLPYHTSELFGKPSIISLQRQIEDLKREVETFRVREAGWEKIRKGQNPTNEELSLLLADDLGGKEGLDIVMMLMDKIHAREDDFNKCFKTTDEKMRAGLQIYDGLRKVMCKKCQAKTLAQFNGIVRKIDETDETQAVREAA